MTYRLALSGIRHQTIAVQQLRACGQPIRIRQGAFQQVADGAPTTDSIQGAIGIKALQNIGLQPYLNRLGLGLSTRAETATGVTGMGS
ncbi:hypothetical protein [Synechococcus sp. CC9616]|uniref:hypothetical protein n=1 Tax=Synechococcus sp. CC9616 TaxID=110663 RepID=UPI001E431DB0|nr:hypothetical protein [Synechococcus sp. CC9616]